MHMVVKGQGLLICTLSVTQCKTPEYTERASECIHVLIAHKSAWLFKMGDDSRLVTPGFLVFYAGLLRVNSITDLDPRRL